MTNKKNIWGELVPVHNFTAYLYLYAVGIVGHLPHNRQKGQVVDSLYSESTTFSMSAKIRSRSPKPLMW